MKKIFIGMSSWSQLFFLWLLFIVGSFISYILVAVIASFFTEGNVISGLNNLMMTSAGFLRMSQVIQQLFLFFIPACLCAYLFHQNSIQYLKINKPISIDNVFFSVLLILLIQPLISFTGYYNRELFHLPQFMSGIENWMKLAEENAAVLTERMLSGDSIESLIINLILVAVIAALVEEFFFRGVLQQVLRKIFNNNYHLAVWITAFIFSAIHMQFYGFIPRLLLGVLLGYLFVFTRNLWAPILAHFINNALAVLLVYFYKNTPQYEVIENIGTKGMWWVALLSFLLTTVVLYYLSKEYTSKLKKNYS